MARQGMEHRFQGGRDGRDARDYHEFRDSRERFQPSGRGQQALGGRDFQMYECDLRENLSRKRQGERGDGREVRQMTESDLRFKLNKEQEGRRFPPAYQSRWEAPRREEFNKRSGKEPPEVHNLCYNCNMEGHQKSQVSQPSLLLLL